MLNTFDFLIILVAFAGHENDIIGSGVSRGIFDGFSSVFNNRAGFSRPCLNLFQYLFRIFASGVVRRQDYFVGSACCRPINGRLP